MDISKAAQLAHCDPNIEPIADLRQLAHRRCKRLERSVAQVAEAHMWRKHFSGRPRADGPPLGRGALAPELSPVLRHPSFQTLTFGLQRQLLQTLRKGAQSPGLAHTVTQLFESSMWASAHPRTQKGCLRELDRRVRMGRSVTPLGKMARSEGFALLRSDDQMRLLDLWAGPEHGAMEPVDWDSRRIILDDLVEDAGFQQAPAAEQAGVLGRLLDHPLVTVSLFSSLEWLGHTFVVTACDGSEVPFSFGQRMDPQRQRLHHESPEPFVGHWPQTGEAATDIYETAGYRITLDEERVLWGWLHRSFDAPNVDSPRQRLFTELLPETLRMLRFVTARRKGPGRPVRRFVRAGREFIPSPELRGNSEFRRLLGISEADVRAWEDREAGGDPRSKHTS